MGFGGLRLHTPPCTPAASTPPSGRTSRSAARGAWHLESCQESPTRHVLKHAILSGIRRWLQDHTESCRRGVGLQDVLKTEQRSPETKLGNISTSLIDRCWSAVAASWRMDGELPTPYQVDTARHPSAHSAVSGRGQMEGRRSTHVGIRPDPDEN